MSEDERHIQALRRECGFYIATGRLENARLVNEQLRLRNAEEVPLPDEPVKRTATSAKAATRKKRS